jgi:hypothetical protein
MDSIQVEVSKFNINLEDFSKICDDELETLLQNIDSVTQSIQVLRQKQSEAEASNI